MEQDGIVDDIQPSSGGVGQRLRAAREAAGLDVAQVAAETRIPQRHLEAIEDGRFGDLPSRTYAIGFTRTYARTLGLDEHEAIQQVRDELAAGSGEDRGAPARFEPGDPARVPGRGLAWFAMLATVLLLGGMYAFYQSYFAPGLGPAPLVEEKPVAAKPAQVPAAGPAAQPAPSGPVVFTNQMDGTWVRFYDGKGERLFEGIMAKGDSYTVPADADNPQLRTGRPYAFNITIGGKPVPRISDKDEVVSDVPVTATALLARPPAPPAGVPSGGSSPVPAPVVSPATAG